MIADKFANLDLKKKITLNIGILSVFVFSASYFLIFPTIDSIKSMENDLELQKIELEEKYNKGQNFLKLKDSFKKIDPKLEIFDKIFINNNRALELITSLENTASSNNVSQKINLLVENGKKENVYLKIPLQISAQGKFSDIIRYLSDLEKSYYYININSISISKIDSHSVSLLLNSETYWK